MSKINTVCHKRSSVITEGVPKQPTTDQIDYGEIAINYAASGETLYIKNSENAIAKFKDDKYYQKQLSDIVALNDNKQDIITDLETIRQGAAKGATALQSYTEQYKGTVTGVKINGTTKNPSNGIVDLGTVITSHQNISGKQDKLVSGTNIKTINNQSLLGSGNIKISAPSITVDTTMSDTSTNPVQNKVIKAYIDGLVGNVEA